MYGVAVIEKPAAAPSAPGRVRCLAASAGSATTPAEIVPPRQKPGHHRVMGATTASGLVSPVAVRTPVRSPDRLSACRSRAGSPCAPAPREDKNATATPADEDKTED